jgi:hypothetical protein
MNNTRSVREHLYKVACELEQKAIQLQDLNAQTSQPDMQDFLQVHANLITEIDAPNQEFNQFLSQLKSLQPRTNPS